MKASVLAVLAVLAIPAAPAGDKDKLRDALGDHALAGTWIYDDLEGGIAEAARSRKPLMVVLRCVP